MFVSTYFRRGNFVTVVAQSSPEALDALPAEVGSLWSDYQLTAKATLSFANLPAQKVS